MWYIEAKTDVKRTQVPLMKKKDVVQTSTANLKEGDTFFQVHLLNVVRKLTFEPSAFFDAMKYRKELDSIGVFVLPKKKKKKSKVVQPSLF